jgi:hypothetical protein
VVALVRVALMNDPANLPALHPMQMAGYLTPLGRMLDHMPVIGDLAPELLL